MTILIIIMLLFFSFGVSLKQIFKNIVSILTLKILYEDDIFTITVWISLHDPVATQIIMVGIKSTGSNFCVNGKACFILKS